MTRTRESQTLARLRADEGRSHRPGTALALTSHDPLAELDEACRLLAGSRDLKAVRKLSDMAEAARLYARAIDRGLEAQNHAAEIKLRAERRAGELLAGLPRERGFAHSSPAETNGTRLQETMREADISRAQANRWQAEAAVPLPMFEQHIASVRESGGELTTAGVLKIAKPLVGGRPQMARAIALFHEKGLTQAHLDAIRAAGMTDAGKARVQQTGTGKNTADVMRLAAEAKAALGGYYREFLQRKPIQTAPTTLARPARVTLLVGDVRAALAGLPRSSVHAAITSPPYYGLRDYQLPPTVWGQSCCEHPHEWGPMERGKRKDILASDVTTLSSRVGTDDRQSTAATDGGRRCQHVHEWQTERYYDDRGSASSSAAAFSQPGAANKERLKDARWREHTTCQCGAWFGSLGLEPSPDCLAWARREPPCSACYVCHMRTVLAALWPVLREDACLWLNLGDSYSGSGKGPTGWNGAGDQSHRQGFTGEGAKYINGRANGTIGAPELGRLSRRAVSGKRGSAGPVVGVRRKNLLLIPERVALAAQADGWIVRSRIPWLKRNAMPESTGDRPASAVEYVLLLARSERVYWDVDAVRTDGDEHSGNAGTFARESSKRGGVLVPGNGATHRADREDRVAGGRNRRNTDWFFESWQGLMCDEGGDPAALVVNPTPYSGAHFATFPSRLVEPMIRASTSERGVCPECGAPWLRQVERSSMVVDASDRRAAASAAGAGRGRTATSGTMTSAPTSETVGWQPSCKHALEAVPATVLDPFAGAASALMAAARLGRDSIGIDLSQPYAEQARDRVQADGGFTVEVELREVHS